MAVPTDSEKVALFYNETRDLLRSGPPGYRFEVVCGVDDRLERRHWPTVDFNFVARVRDAARRLGKDQVVGVRLDDQNLLVVVAPAITWTQGE